MSWHATAKPSLGVCPDRFLETFQDRSDGASAPLWLPLQIWQMLSEIEDGGPRCRQAWTSTNIINVNSLAIAKQENAYLPNAEAALPAALLASARSAGRQIALRKIVVHGMGCNREFEM